MHTRTDMPSMGQEKSPLHWITTTGKYMASRSGQDFQNLWGIFYGPLYLLCQSNRLQATNHNWQRQKVIASFTLLRMGAKRGYAPRSAGFHAVRTIRRSLGLVCQQGQTVVSPDPLGTYFVLCVRHARQHQVAWSSRRIFCKR